MAHDPDDALFAGPDGLALMPALIALAGRLLRPGGLLASSTARSQAAALHRLLAAAGCWDEVAGRPDLTGRPRFSTAVRRPSDPAAAPARGACGRMVSHERPAGLHRARHPADWRSAPRPAR